MRMCCGGQASWLSNWIAGLLMLGCAFSFGCDGFRVARSPISQDELAELESANDDVWSSKGWRFPFGWSSVADESECLSWAKSFEKAVANRAAIKKAQARFWDNKELQRLTDFAPLGKRCVDLIPDRQYAEDYLRQNSMLDAITGLLEQATNYRLLGVLKNEFDEPAALFRIDDANGASAYHLWSVKKTEKGNVVGVDVYFYAMDESFGDSMRRIVTKDAPPAGTRERFEQGTPTPADEAWMETRTFQLKLADAPDVESKLEVYDQFPARMKDDKFYLRTRFILASAASRLDLCFETINRYVELFPNEVSADLLRLDLHEGQKEYGELEQTIDRLEKVILPNAHTYYLRSTALVGQGRTKEAIEQLQHSIESEPDFEISYWMLGNLQVAEKDFDGVAKTFKGLLAEFSYETWGLEGMKEYDEFREAPQYRELVRFYETVRKKR